MNILHLDTNHPLLLKMLEDAGFSNEENYTASKVEIESIISKYQGIVIRSRFNIDKQFLDAAKNLKFIARVGAGLESIETDYAETLGIKLIAAPEGNRNAVGEHTLGMLLSLFNKLNNADKEVKSGHWNREANRGVELDGKTVGIIGYGNMGQAFAKKLRGFECEVICYDLKENVGNEDARQVSLNVLQQNADVLSLHTPWTPLTDKMIDSVFIHSFAKPFWLLNTARGKSVVTADLVSALKTGKVLGAGLDVLEYEKLSFESLFQPDASQNNTNRLPESLKELFKMKQVILSPHIAGWTIESKEKLAKVIAEKIINNFKI
ncbi:2-hydroxyacid dehydrogenase [Aequorivita sp. Q41]|uniref:2-hydroxyacid dehydrogenase n=1 Tax=Aequorivita sp. Q41 TaxID=3153300 RepID=UPI00324291EE